MTTVETLPKDMMIRRGRIKRPNLIVIHGTGGVGKSTFAMHAPHPVFADVEEGTSHLNLDRTPEIKIYEDLLAQLDWLQKANHDYKTLVIDGLDELELRIHDFIVRTKKTDKGKSVEHVEDFGWGKGYSYAQQTWSDLVEKLKSLRDVRGMNVILIAHSEEKMIEDVVRGESYKRLRIKLNPKITNLIQEQADCVLFATHEVLISKDKEKVNALSEGKRIMYTEYRPQWDAKNRLGLPFSLPLDWESFKEAAEKGDPESADALKQSIVGLLSRITNEEVKKSAAASLERAASNASELSRIKNKLLTIVEQGKE